MELLRRLQSKSWSPGKRASFGSHLAVENPRVDLGISWFRAGVEIITIIIQLCRSCPSVLFLSH